MSAYTEYAARLEEQHAALQGSETPLSVRCGTEHARRQLERFGDVLIGARKRVREEQIKQLLQVKPEWDLLWRAPLSAPVPLQEVVARETRLLVVGPAAVGEVVQNDLAVNRPKSSRPLAGDEPDNDRYVTLLVDLPDLPNLADVSLPQVLSADASANLALSVEPAAFQDLLIRGQAVVCVSGLDELPDQPARAQAIKQIEGWMAEFPNCHYVVTARPNACQPTLDVDDFSRCVLDLGDGTFYGELEQTWNEALAGWTPEDPDMTAYVEQGRLWQHLAFLMKEQGRGSIAIQEAQDGLVEAVRQDKGLRIARRKQSGEVAALLEQAPPQLALVQVDEGQLSFDSASLVDLLAARALVTLCVDSGVDAAWEQMAGRIESPSWQETLKLALRFTLQESPELGAQLFERVLVASGSESWEPVLHRGLLLAADALGGVSDGAAPVQGVVDGLAAWMANGEAVGRSDAVDALYGLAGQSYAQQKVLELLGDAELDAWTRQAAALLLGDLGRGQAAETVEALRARVEDDKEGPRVQQAALLALGALGGSGMLEQDVLDALVTWLSERAREADLGLDPRVGTLEALGTIVAQSADASVDAPIVELLFGLARGENEDEHVPYSVRSMAAQGLKRLALTQDVEQLVEQIWGTARDVEIDDSVRAIFAETLGQLGQAEEAAKMLIELAQDSSVRPPGHRSAMQALGRVGYADQEILDVLARIATTKDRKTKDFERLAASVAMSGVGHLDLSLQYLLMLIADKSIYRSTRNDALGYLGHLGSTGNEDLDAAAVAVLQIWANEENTTEDVRENAIDSLCWLHAGQDEVIRDVIGVIQNRGTYPRVRRYAAGMLHRLPIAEKEMVVESLSSTFYDPEEKSDLLRVPLARMLFLWGEDESALSYLRAAAEQSYMAQVRYNASMVLLEIGELEGAYAELIKLAQNPEIADPIRRDSLRALGLSALGREDVAEAVSAVAQDATLESNVRAAAYASLGSIVAA
jgi:hypothetical protein